MHFSIPDTQELKDESGSVYTSFNVHINGVFHCSVRYSSLYTFQEQLKKEFGILSLPPFPPKKFFPLSPAKVEERRQLLERFIQIVSQDPNICNSDTFNGFFLTAQQETQKEVSEAATLDVFLMNGHKITIKVMSTDQTEDVLELAQLELVQDSFPEHLIGVPLVWNVLNSETNTLLVSLPFNVYNVASQIELSEDFVYYFALFLVKKEEDGDNSLVRKLQEFESPFISLKYANKMGPHRIVLRKSFWDIAFEDDLLDNKIAMNLLYVQAVNDIERQWTLGKKEQIKHLQTLQQRGSKREYLRLSRTLKYYGYIHFKPCETDYPSPHSRVLIAAGNKELNFRIQTDSSAVKEGSFKITRMRCWRITTSIPEQNGQISFDSDKKPKLELAFEYLMSKDTLKWITVTTDQAILISMCLQSMVDELIMKKQDKKIKRPQDRSKGGSSSKTTLPRDNSFASKINQQFSFSSPTEEKPKGKGLSQGDNFVANGAFDTIGDDDL